MLWESKVDDLFPARDASHVVAWRSMVNEISKIGHQWVGLDASEVFAEALHPDGADLGARFALVVLSHNPTKIPHSDRD